jgi:RNA polymerase sigma-70 factor, ECF subfamily
VQQVFLKLWHMRETLEIRNQTKSYLHRAVVNTSLNFIARKKKISYQADISKFDISETTFIQDDGYNENLALELKEAIQTLPPQCQTVFSLSRYSDMSNKEIALNLNISIKAVEKHIGKALKELRIKLKPLYETLQIIIFLFWR